MAEMRYIVRIANKDVDGNLPIFLALRGIKGIDHRMGRMIAYQFEKESGIKFDSKIGVLDESHDKKLEDIVLNPGKHTIPIWAMNRRKNEDGIPAHKVMSDLDLANRTDLQTMKRLKSYKGIRHGFGLTVRGQKTKTSGRHSGALGVQKAAAEPGKAASKPAAGGTTATGKPAKVEEKKK